MQIFDRNAYINRILVTHIAENEIVRENSIICDKCHNTVLRDTTVTCIVCQKKVAK